MWGQPATAKQISALKANGNFDGKYYSKGRAGQVIGQSVRASSASRQDTLGNPPLGSFSLTGSGSVTGQPARQLPAEVSTTSTPVLDADIVVSQVLADRASSPARLVAPVDTVQSVQRGVLSFAFLNDLEARHLRSFQSEHSSNWGSELRRETRAWADLKAKVARTATQGLSELIAILDEAPSDVIPDAAAAASELMATASPEDLEERHLRTFMSEHSSNWGSDLRREILGWVASRIELAKTNARAIVELAKAQEARRPSTTRAIPSLAPAVQPAPPASASAEPNGKSVSPRPGRKLQGRVERINAHGAVVLLSTGERGWLHVSKLRVLNGGERIDDVATILQVGEEIRVRVTGINERGQAQLALVRPTSPAPRSGADATVKADELRLEPDTPVSSPARRGVLARLLPTRSEQRRS